MRISLKNKNSESVSGFYKYDFGQVLEIEGLELPEQFEVHFQNGTGTPVTINGTYNSESGIATVPIPDECFQQEALVFDAWLWVEDERSGKTLKTITFYLIDRECPEGVPPISSVNEIKGYADFVRENAEKVAEAQQAANDVEEFLNTADSKISEATNSKLDKQQGIENAGRILKVGSDGNIGLGDVKNHLKTKVLYSYEEFEAYVMELYENFSEYAPLWLIYGFDDSESNITIGTGMLILDDGTGTLENALIVDIVLSEIPFTRDLKQKIEYNMRYNTRTRMCPLEITNDGNYAIINNYQSGFVRFASSIGSTKSMRLLITPNDGCNRIFVGLYRTNDYTTINIPFKDGNPIVLNIHFITNDSGILKQIIYDCNESKYSKVVDMESSIAIQQIVVHCRGSINFTVNAYGEVGG